MQELEIEIEPRPRTGSVAAATYRKNNFVPVVAYSEGKPSIPGMVPVKEFTRMANKANWTQLFVLKSKDSTLNGRLALVKELQVDYMNGTALHADFVLVRENQKIKVRVPLHVKGEAVGVKTDGGVLTITHHDIGVMCLPRGIPAHFEVDVTALALGHSLHARDVALPEGVDLADDPEETLISVVAPRAVEEVAAPVAAEGEAAAAAGAEGEAKEGEAAAAGDGAEKKEKK